MLNNATPQQVAEFINHISEMYPRFSISNYATKKWIYLFSQYPLEVLERAFDKHLQSSRFAPSISQLIALVKQYQPSASEEYIIPAGEKPELPEGFVRCWARNGDKWKFAGIHLKTDAIVHEHRWKTRVDFIMDILGAEKTTALYREWVKGLGVTTKDLTTKPDSINRESYLKFRRLLLDTAIHKAKTLNLSKNIPPVPENDSW